MKKLFFVIVVAIISSTTQTFSKDSTKVAAKSFDASKFIETKNSKSVNPFTKKGSKLTNAMYVYNVEHDSIHNFSNCAVTSDFILEMTAWCGNQNKTVIGLPNDLTAANAMAMHQSGKEVTRDVPANSLKIAGMDPKTCEPRWFLNEKELKNQKMIEFTFDNGVAIYIRKADCDNLVVDLSPRVPPVKKEDTTRVYREATDYGGLTVIGDNNIVNSNVGQPAPAQYYSYNTGASGGYWQPSFQPQFYAGGYCAVPYGGGLSLSFGAGGFGFSFGFYWGDQMYCAYPATPSVCSAVNTYYNCGGTVVNNYITPASNTVINNNTVVVNNNNNNVVTVTNPTPPTPPNPEPPIPPVDPGDPVWGSTGNNGNPTNPDWGSTGNNGGVPPTDPDWGSTGGQAIPPTVNARKAAPVTTNTATTKPSTIPATKKTEFPAQATSSSVKKVDGKIASTTPTTKPATAVKPATASNGARNANGTIVSTKPVTKTASTSVRNTSASVTKPSTSSSTRTNGNVAKPSSTPQTEARVNDRAVAVNQRSNDAQPAARGNTQYVKGNPNVAGNNIVNNNGTNGQTRVTGTDVRSNPSVSHNGNSNQQIKTTGPAKSYQQNTAGSRPQQIASNQQRPAYSKGQINSAPRSSGGNAISRPAVKSPSSAPQQSRGAMKSSSGVKQTSGGAYRKR